MQKKDRQDLILHLIRSELIGQQDVLAKKLAQHGFLVTQASVSRDLEELGVVKTDGVYEIPKVSSAAMEFGLRSIETAGDNLIVGKCDSGLASAITVRIDGGQTCSRSGSKWSCIEGFGGKDCRACSSCGDG